MKPNPATKTPIAASKSTNDAEVDSNLEPTPAPNVSSFRWKTCMNETERDRVDIKQQAVLDALRLGERLSNILRSRINDKDGAIMTEDLEEWEAQFGAVKESYETPHSTVGLIGALGSGKSTLLNALLGERELLPSSSDRAGTAVACQVVYNHGCHGYRAETLFRSRQSFTDELDELFENLKKKRKLQARMAEDPEAAENEEIEGELEDLEKITTDTLETLFVLLGVKEDDLSVTSTKEFLDDHPLEVLGTMMEVTETDREIFVTKIKPFLDSTPANYGGRELTLWPLIDHVTIYVNSDILKYGIQLVDLPGLGDAVEGRSRVAERFAKTLDITAIIAPAIRATEEKTVIGFTKRRQEDAMRMNGKFDRDSLCVVVSKSEDLDPNNYLKEKWIAKNHPDLEDHLKRAQELDKTIREIEAGLIDPEPGMLGHNTNAASEGSEIESHRRQFLNLRESLKQTAVFVRNRNISERIQKGFRERLVPAKSSDYHQVDDDTIEVFPTSARAYQEIRHPGGEKETGFPDENYTGVPRFMQWLFEVTFKRREKHLDATLNDLASLFARMQSWISALDTVAVAPIDGLHELESIHRRYHRALTTILRQSGEQLRQIEPLKAKEAALALCRKEYPGKIDRWRFTYPDRPISALKLHANVQTCILRKNGDYHQSKGKYPHEYQWIDVLAHLFFNEIYVDWAHAFHIIVPSYENKIQDSLEHVWRRYMMALDGFCNKPETAQARFIGKVREAIENAETHLGHNIYQSLAHLESGARDVHPLFQQEIQRIMKPVFQEAYETRGAGCVRKRDEILKRFARDHSADMAVKACEEMEAGLEKLLQRHVEALEGHATGAVRIVRRQMRLLLGINQAAVSPAARDNQRRLAAEINPHLTSWKLCWQKPSSQREDHVMRGDLSIPEPELIKVKGAV
ncbi:hypothetical protein J7T55_000149 [Diaporthe amygdali]|uniref:uncharacterized protein n=1 Tax=Phomopsis amygdali TaxID=1214568 RepID=UPI0022FF4426|nr:uncharacterized protein J7T55_000149 [Diaporthe amygdali]KAJ0108184.1 hypothetical protein J7T55_000149 [Diaporthe amygdali]